MIVLIAVLVYSEGAGLTVITVNLNAAPPASAQSSSVAQRHRGVNSGSRAGGGRRRKEGMKERGVGGEKVRLHRTKQMLSYADCQQSQPSRVGGFLKEGGFVGRRLKLWPVRYCGRQSQQHSCTECCKG